MTVSKVFAAAALLASAAVLPGVQARLTTADLDAPIGTSQDDFMAQRDADGDDSAPPPPSPEPTPPPPAPTPTEDVEVPPPAEDGEDVEMPPPAEDVEMPPPAENGEDVEVPPPADVVEAPATTEPELRTEAGSGGGSCGGAVVRDINWNGRSAGSYPDAEAEADFSPANYIKRVDQASIEVIGGTSYMANTMRKGCYGTGADIGCGLYARLPLNDRVQSDTMTMEMTVRFGPDFEWVRGGKLPGFCQGSCKGGCGASGPGFSTRIMWTDNECSGHADGECAKVFNFDKSRGGKWINDRPDGGLHVYLYGAESCAEELTFQNGGKSIIIQSETDYTIRTVVKMNSPGKSDGYVKAYLNGNLAAQKTDFVLVPDGGIIDQLMFDNFFGGTGEAMAAQKDEKVLFKDLKIWEGDCGATGGGGGGGDGGDVIAAPADADRGFRTDGEAPPVPAPTPTAVFQQHTIDPAAFNGGGPMDIELGTTKLWKGGFCQYYEIVNIGPDECDNFAVEVNVDPALWAYKSSTSALRSLGEKPEIGWFLYGRASGFNTFTPPGTRRQGQFCGTTASGMKALYSEAQLRETLTITAICNGEDKGTDPQPV